MIANLILNEEGGEMSNTKVLITGATGNQGRAVVDAAMAAGLSVRAMVRDTSKPKARTLAARGVEVVLGDLDDGASVEAAARGVDVAFVLTTPFAGGVDIEGEIRRGRTVIDGLARASIGHIVYSSVSDADQHTSIPHFDSKADAEGYLAASGIPFTITAPVYFADNVALPWNLPDLKKGKFRQALPADRVLQVVPLEDIGRFNAAVIQRRSNLVGRRINYASDELSPTQMTDALSAAIGRTIVYEQQPLEEVRATLDEMGAMYEWFDRVGYSAEIDALKTEFPEVEWTPFSRWVESQDWTSLLAEGAS